MDIPTPATPRPGYPASPCVRQCALDERKVCLGCRRTLEEIIAWSSMTAAEQWLVVNRLATR